MCNDNEHNYIVANVSDKYMRKIGGYGSMQYKCYRVCSLICTKCGKLKEIEIEIEKYEKHGRD